MAAALPTIAAAAIAVAAKTDLMLVMFILPLGGLLLGKNVHLDARVPGAGATNDRDLKNLIAAMMNARSSGAMRPRPQRGPPGCVSSIFGLFTTAPRMPAHAPGIRWRRAEAQDDTRYRPELMQPRQAARCVLVSYDCSRVSASSATPTRWRYTISQPFQPVNSSPSTATSDRMNPFGTTAAVPSL